MAASAGCVAAAPDQPKAKACSAPEYRQVDFWVGDWDVFDVDNPSTVVARTRVDLILDGCVLREDYQGLDGPQGQSFTSYDASRKIWHQSWVTNRGESLTIEGGATKDDAIVLSGNWVAGQEERFAAHGSRRAKRVSARPAWFRWTAAKPGRPGSTSCSGRTKRCSLRAINPGVVQPPVFGKVQGDPGEFVGDDTLNGKKILCRYRWTRTGSPRWEQAFSADGGKTWETNWIMMFTKEKS